MRNRFYGGPSSRRRIGVLRASRLQQLRGQRLRLGERPQDRRAHQRWNSVPARARRARHGHAHLSGLRPRRPVLERSLDPADAPHLATGRVRPDPGAPARARPTRGSAPGAAGPSRTPATGGAGSSHSRVDTRRRTSSPSSGARGSGRSDPGAREYRRGRSGPGQHGRQETHAKARREGKEHGVASASAVQLAYEEFQARTRPGPPSRDRARRAVKNHSGAWI